MMRQYGTQTGSFFCQKSKTNYLAILFVIFIPQLTLAQKKSLQSLEVQIQAFTATNLKSEVKKILEEHATIRLVQIPNSELSITGSTLPSYKSDGVVLTVKMTARRIDENILLTLKLFYKTDWQKEILITHANFDHILEKQDVLLCEGLETLLANKICTKAISVKPKSKARLRAALKTQPSTPTSAILVTKNKNVLDKKTSEKLPSQNQIPIAAVSDKTDKATKVIKPTSVPPPTPTPSPEVGFVEKGITYPLPFFALTFQQISADQFSPSGTQSVLALGTELGLNSRTLGIVVGYNSSTLNYTEASGANYSLSLSAYKLRKRLFERQVGNGKPFLYDFGYNNNLQFYGLLGQGTFTTSGSLTKSPRSGNYWSVGFNASYNGVSNFGLEYLIPSSDNAQFSGLLLSFSIGAPL